MDDDARPGTSASEALDHGVRRRPLPEGVELRPFRDGDWERYLSVDERTFGYALEEDDLPAETGVFEADRALVADVDGVATGNLGAYTLALSVPGGAAVPTAGATWVGVLPTAQRRGVGRALIEAHLADSRRRGDVLGALWASQPGIYGRFGYGLAAWSQRIVVPAGGELDEAPHDPAVVVRFAEPADALPDISAVLAQVALVRPGIPARDERWWMRAQHDTPARRGGAGPLRYLVASDADGPRGYAAFATSLSWAPAGVPDGEVQVRELLAVDPAARAALWRVLLGHDLMSRVEWWNAPVDEPLLTWRPDRSAVQSRRDTLFIRLLDLPAALTVRRYSVPLEVVIEVRDDLIPVNAGRWRLVVDDEGSATCAPAGAEAAPDLVLDVRELGAAYLGSSLLGSLADAGLVEVRSPRALAAASAAFGHAPAAWCPLTF